MRPTPGAYIIQPPTNAPSVSSSKLQQKLESQKHSSLIDLSDCFIGDQGCHLLHQFFKEHGEPVTTLELRGNNITGPGAHSLSDAIRLTPNLRKLQLEWNDVGISDPGMQALCETIGEHPSLQNVSMRNNKITAQSGMYLGNMINSSASLQILDLRWNQISATGARGILKGLKQNNSLVALQLTGNNVPEDLQQQITAIISKNRDYLGYTPLREHSPMHSNFSISDNRRVNNSSQKYQDNQDQRTPRLAGGGILKRNQPPFKGDEFIMQLKAKKEQYEIKMKRNNKKFGQINRIITSQSGNREDIHNNYSKQIDNQRMGKEQVMQMLSKIKDQMNKKEIKSQTHKKQAQMRLDLQQRQFQILQNERKQLQQSQNEAQRVMQQKVEELEGQLKEVQKEGRISDEQQKTKLQMMRKRQLQDVSMMKQQWNAKIHNLQQALKDTIKTKQQSLAENKSLHKEMLDLKMTHEQSLAQIRKKVGASEKQKYDSILNSMIQRVNSINQAKGQYQSKIQQISREVTNQERDNAGKISQVEREAGSMNEQSILIKKKAEVLSIQNSRLQNQLAIKNATLQKIQANKQQLQSQLKQQQIRHIEKLKEAKQQFNKEKEGQDQRVHKLHQKVAALEKELNHVISQNNQIDLYNDNLAQKLVLQITRSVRNVFAKREE